MPQDYPEIMLLIHGVLIVLITVFQLKMLAMFRHLANQISGPRPGGNSYVDSSQTESLETQYSGGDPLNSDENRADISDSLQGEDANTSPPDDPSQEEYSEQTETLDVRHSSGEDGPNESGADASTQNGTEPPVDDLQASDGPEPSADVGDRNESDPDKQVLDKLDSESAGDAEAKGTEESKQGEPPASEKPRKPAAIEDGEELIQIQGGDQALFDSETDPADPVAVEESEAASADNERLRVLNVRYARSKEILAKSRAEFQADEQRLEPARKEYDHWRDYLTVLVKTYENDLLYEFTEILEDDRFHIKELKKMMILPLTQNETENEKQLKARAKDLSQEVEYLDIPRFSEALTGLKDVHVRRGGDGDYHLEESGFAVELTADVRIFLKNFLDTLLMIYRQLRGKNLKGVFKLLSGASESDQHIRTPLQKPDLMAFIFSEEPYPEWPLDPETLGKMTNHNCGHVQKAVEVAEAFRKKYFEYLERNLLRALNSLKQAKANYCQIVDQRFAEHKSALSSWGEIFDALINLLSDYLEDHLHIRVIPCQRGDEFDPERSTPTGPVEADDELGPHRVKSVDEDGYQYVHQDRILVVKPVRVTVTE